MAMTENQAYIRKKLRARQSVLASNPDNFFYNPAAVRTPALLFKYSFTTLIATQKMTRCVVYKY